MCSLLLQQTPRAVLIIVACVHVFTPVAANTQSCVNNCSMCSCVRACCSKHPELYKWFKEFLGHKESGNTSETIPQGATKERSVRDEYNMEIGRHW